MFEFFKVSCGKGLPRSVKKTLAITILIEYEYAEGRVGTKSKSLVSDLITQQENLTTNLEEMTVLFAKHGAKIAQLKATVQKNISKGPGAIDAHR